MKILSKLFGISTQNEENIVSDCSENVTQELEETKETALQDPDVIFTKEDIFKEVLRCINHGVVDPNIWSKRDTSGVKDLMYKRLNALIQAYNSDIGTQDKLIWFRCGTLIGPTCSTEKLIKLSGISEVDFNESGQRINFFSALLQYYINSESLNHTFDGVLECSNEFYVGIQYSQKVNAKISAIIKEEVLTVLLLLGDKYDKTFSKKELCLEYGFPKESEDQIREMIINECYCD